MRNEAARELPEALTWIARLDPVRRAVLIDMRHNLGQRGLLRFRRTLAAVEAHNAQVPPPSFTKETSLIRSS